MHQPWSTLEPIVTGIIGITALLLVSVGAASADWYAKRLVEALRAAPPEVARTARIYARGDDGQDAHLVLIRGGTGPYT
jgi:hypothetical protein